MRMGKSSPSAAKGRIVIGKVGAPHGVAGEVKIIPMTDFPRRFIGMDHCYVGDNATTIAGARFHGQNVLMKFDGVSSREAARALTGKFLSVDRAEAVPLGEGEYYTADILGLAVEDTEGKKLGTVTDVIRTGSNDVYAVSLPGRKDDILVPALKKVVLKISLDEGRMVVSMPEAVE